jgi:hypothetical protein
MQDPGELDVVSTPNVEEFGKKGCVKSVCCKACATEFGTRRPKAWSVYREANIWLY